MDFSHPGMIIEGQISSNVLKFCGIRATNRSTTTLCLRPYRKWTSLIPVIYVGIEGQIKQKTEQKVAGLGLGAF